MALVMAGCAGMFNRPPVASFTWTPTSPLPNEEVRFDASASSDPDSGDSIIKYSWTFGEGSTGVGVKTTHRFAKSGTYEVTLTVEDGCGKTAGTARTITVRQCPIKISGMNIRDLNGGRIEAGDKLQFCVSAEHCGAPATGLQAVWTFGDGSATKTGQCVEHCFERGCREYTVRVTVTDSSGNTDSVSKCLYVFCQDGCPTAVIKYSVLQPTGLDPVPVCSEILLDGRNSHDNDKCCVSCGCPTCPPPNPCPLPSPCDGLSSQGCGDCQVPCDGRDRIVSWKWEIFPPTGISIVKWGSTVRFTPTQNGQYLIQLSAEDDEGGWDTKTTHIQVDGCGCCP